MNPRHLPLLFFLVTKKPIPYLLPYLYRWYHLFITRKSILSGVYDKSYSEIRYKALILADLNTPGWWLIHVHCMYSAFVNSTCSDAGRLPYIGKTFIFMADWFLIHSLATSLQNNRYVKSYSLNSLYQIFSSISGILSLRF